MATWFDLPTEIKQLVCEFVTDTESIVYIPRDRRRKVDSLYNATQHFHNILLVAKSFITTGELAFAILRKAVVTFYSYNQLRRLLIEVNPAFTKCIRRISLSRIFFPADNPTTAVDSFDSFSSIPKALAKMPDLRQIHISWDDYCAPLGMFQPFPGQSFPDLDQYFTMLSCALKRTPGDEIPHYYHPTPYVDVLGSVIASFIGDRKFGSAPRYSAGYESSLAWTKPHGWIRRLVQYSEENDIEVILNVTLCISSDFAGPEDLNPDQILPGRYRESLDIMDSCWCNRDRRSYRRHDPYVEMHVQAQMSTKDWKLRVQDNEGKRYAFQQDLAYQMLHAKPRATAEWWENLLLGLRYNGRNGDRPQPKFAF